MPAMFVQGFRHIAVALVALAAALIALSEPAAMECEALLDALRGGGYVVYFRHAETDWSQRDRIDSEASLVSCDATRMRQLSDQGSATARAVGAAMRRLMIPVSAVYASEYCRCVETADLLDVGPVEITRDIRNMRAAQYASGHAALVAAARLRLSSPRPSDRTSCWWPMGMSLWPSRTPGRRRAGRLLYRPRGRAVWRSSGC